MLTAVGGIMLLVASCGPTYVSNGYGYNIYYDDYMDYDDSGIGYGIANNFGNGNNQINAGHFPGGGKIGGGYYPEPYPERNGPRYPKEPRPYPVPKDQGLLNPWNEGNDLDYGFVSEGPIVGNINNIGHGNNQVNSGHFPGGGIIGGRPPVYPEFPDYSDYPPYPRYPQNNRPRYPGRQKPSVTPPYWNERRPLLPDYIPARIGTVNLGSTVSQGRPPITNVGNGNNQVNTGRFPGGGLIGSQQHKYHSYSDIVDYDDFGEFIKRNPRVLQPYKTPQRKRRNSPSVPWLPAL